MSNLSLAALVGVQIVQVTLCIVAGAVLSFGCLRRHPALAAAVWLAVLCKCATPPIWASPLGVFSWLHAEKPRTPTPLPSWLEHVKANPRPTSPLVEEPPVAAIVPSAPSFDWASLWPWLLAGVWGTGFVWTFSRAFRLRRRWLASVVEDCDPPESLVHAVAERSKKLGMKPPRMVMVAADAGPAASGWFRPTVYLPVGADPTQMESMLVHELVHLRRRDPWLGALQAFVSSAYWFHPGVRWASDELSRCIEEACDAETVRELGCKPVEYAAALVALLERRVAPPSVPMVAGMSPARSVKRRLEAVMKTNPKRCGKFARGPWLAFAAATLIALPGAGLPPEPLKSEVKQGPIGPIYPQPVPAPVAVDFAWPIGPPPKQIEIKNFSHRGYDLKPAINVLVKRGGLREDAAGNAVANLAIAAAEHIGPRPVFAIANQRLFAFAAEAQHVWMSRALTGTVDELAVDQVVIESEIWDVPQATLDAMHFDVRDAKNGVGTAFIAESDYKELSLRILADKGANMLATPKVVTLDGQNSTIKIAKEHALDGETSKDGKPLTATVGLCLDLTPKISADGRYISMKVRYEESNLVRPAPQPAASPDESTSAAPIVNSRVTETRVSAGWGIRIAIKTERSKLLVFRCTKAPGPTANFDTNPPGDGKLQANAEPRIKEEFELFRRRAKLRLDETRIYPVDHFLRGNTPAERQATDLLHAWFALFSVMEAADLKVTEPGKTIPPHRWMLTVKMPRELHESFSRMLRDVDPRTVSNDFAFPVERRGTPPIGN